MRPCTQCGQPASFWRRDLTTGICRKCRKAEAEQNPLSLSNLTWSGWLLTLVTIGVIVGLMIPFGGWLYQLLPGGRYPALILALPVLVLGLALFGAGAVALKQLGLPVWKHRQQSSEEPSD